MITETGLSPRTQQYTDLLIEQQRQQRNDPHSVYGISFRSKPKVELGITAFSMLATARVRHKQDTIISLQVLASHMQQRYHR